MKIFARSSRRMYNLIDNWISMSLARLKTRRDYYQVVLLGILVYGKR